MLLPAFRAFSLDDEGDGVRKETCGKFETWYLNVFHAERTLARLTVEMNVPIVVVALAVLFAKFIVQNATPVFEGMYHIVLQEKGEGTEDTRLVHRYHLAIQVAKAHRLHLAS